MSKTCSKFYKLEFINKMFLLCYFALTMFTPLYPMQKMILLLGTFVLWYLTAIKLKPRFSSDTAVLVCLMFGMLFMGWISSVMNENSMMLNAVVNTMPNLAWAFLGVFYVSYDKDIGNFKWLLFGILIVSSLYTLVGNINYPGASRLLTGTQEYYAIDRDFYRSLNIGGYGFIFSLVFLVLPISMLMRKYSHQRLVLFFSLILFVVTILVSSFMTGIIIASIMLVLAFVKNGKAIRIIIAMGLFFSLVWVFKENVLAFIISIGEAIDSDILVKRAEQLLLGSYLADAGMDDNNRLTIFGNAIQNWLENPVFGSMLGDTTSVYRRSGHSEMLGYLEKWGFFAIVYFAYFRCVYKRISNALFTKSFRQVYLIYFLVLMFFMTVDRFDTFIEIGCIAFFLGPVLMKMTETNNAKE